MASPAGIPLQCNICPRKPSFSDVSHLLTHIASKGHLSHYYKIKVRSSNEAESRRLVEEYDQWYAEWNVEDLMSERMNLKDKRRLRPRVSSRSTSTSSKSNRQRNSARPTNPSTLADLRVSDHHVKREPQATPPLSEIASLPRALVHRMPYWPPSQMPLLSQRVKEDSEVCSTADSDYTEWRSLQQLNSSAGDEEENTTANHTMAVSECTKLKGVFWPGMDLFDSATPEMRRKRNQKKDTSVVEQLEANSQEVEPTEMIFTPYGSLKKSRVISGSVDLDTSPLKTPSPTKTRPSRVALQNMDTNGARRVRYGPPPVFGRRSATTYEDDQNEMRLTYGQHNQRRKRDFSIFQDPEVHRTTVTQPNGLNFLASALHFPAPDPPRQLFEFDNKPVLEPYSGFNATQNSFHAATGLDPTFEATQQCPFYNSFTPAMPSNEMAGLFNNSMFFSAYSFNDDDDDEGRTLTGTPSDT